MSIHHHREPPRSLRTWVSLTLHAISRMWPISVNWLTNCACNGATSALKEFPLGEKVASSCEAKINQWALCWEGKIRWWMLRNFFYLAAPRTINFAWNWRARETFEKNLSRQIFVFLFKNAQEATKWNGSGTEKTHFAAYVTSILEARR